MEKYTKEQKLKNRIEAINKLRKFQSETVPKLVEFFAKGNFKIKANGVNLFDKDKKVVQEILKTDVRGIRVYLDVNQYSITANYDVYYKNSEFGCNYYKNTIYLVDTSNKKMFDDIPKKFEKINFDKAQKAIKKIEKYQSQLEGIECIISDLQSTYCLSRR